MNSVLIKRFYLHRSADTLSFHAGLEFRKLPVNL